MKDNSWQYQVKRVTAMGGAPGMPDVIKRLVNTGEGTHLMTLMKPEPQQTPTIFSPPPPAMLQPKE